MENIFRKKDLPLSDFEKLGLYRGSHLDLDQENIDALLAGRRTDMVSLKNLKAEGIHIGQLDARLSLGREPDGTLSLMVHPIYKEAQQHELLVNDEAEQLKSGKLSNITKAYTDADGKTRTVIIEYDGETKEFISYDPQKVTAPNSVDNKPLTSSQQDDFKKGKVVELEDGTRLQHKATERKGILSNRTGLFLSILVDGGISYFLVTGIKNLMNNKEKQKEGYYKGYEDAMKEVEKRQVENARRTENNEQLHHFQQGRGYGRTTSR
ncbi:DUF4099 domain-containing protein [Sphingobacterium lactis]|uniref:DUF4099 domain-containing protein n=1 Tax=Sphingobacterium TaxID=28453 RepID=UPI0021A936D7|nr:DUF4099 domain-containing protein [Sphingobacterium hotanense]MCT1525817.1 DUF4099 domain-containing protein [Sphingobacterium hotanense]